MVDPQGEGVCESVALGHWLGVCDAQADAVAEDEVRGEDEEEGQVEGEKVCTGEAEKEGLAV